MWQNIKKYLLRCNKTGFYVPYFHDPISNTPSITITFAYVSFIFACISVVSLHFRPEDIMAAWTTIGFWAIATVLYMVRKINKLNLDFENKKVSINENSEQTEEAPKE